MLAGGLGVRHVVVGADFRFGKGRAGDVGTLAGLGAALGFGVTVAPLISDAAAATSPRRRSARRWPRAGPRRRRASSATGTVSRAGCGTATSAAGRSAFPTANLALEGLHLPRFGVYAVLVDVLDGPHAGRYRGAASIGVRPTFGENAPNLEVHLLDFDGDLYGAELSVALVAWLRPELKFDAIEPLVAQMRADVAEARAAARAGRVR